MPRTKLSAYRLNETDLQRVEQLAELLNVTRTDVIRGAIRTFARHHGVLGTETARRVRELIARFGPEAEVVLAVIQGTSNVPVSVGGKPTTELAAVCSPQPNAPQDRFELPRLPDPVPVTLWLRNSDPTIKFLVDPQRPGTTIRFPATDLWERYVIAPEPDAESTQSNRAIRAAAGYALDADDDEEEAPTAE